MESAEWGMKEEEGCFYNVMERFLFSPGGPPFFIPLPSKESVAAAADGGNRRGAEQSANIPRIWG